MGGHDVKLPKVPDWRVYKVENVPQLMVVKKALAEYNLKDPWLRNYVWMYDEYVNKPSHQKNLLHVIFRGFKMGLVAAVATTVLEKAFYAYYYKDDGRDEHHEHH